MGRAAAATSEQATDGGEIGELGTSCARTAPQPAERVAASYAPPAASYAPPDRPGGVGGNLTGDELLTLLVDHGVTQVEAAPHDRRQRAHEEVDVAVEPPLSQVVG